MTEMKYVLGTFFFFINDCFLLTVMYRDSLKDLLLNNGYKLKQ